MQTKILITTVMCLLLMQVHAQDPNSQVDNVATDLDNPNFINTYAIDAIGGVGIDAYKNRRNQYFYSPPLLVDWDNFNKQLDSCKGQPDNKVVELKLRIIFYKKEIFDELKMLLERDEGRKNITLNILPYTYFVVKVKIGGDYIIINPSDLPTFSNIGQLKTKFTITSPKDYLITGRLKDLRNFYAFRSVDANLKGSIYSGGNTYSSDYVKGTADFANSTSIKKQLFGDETLVNNIRVSSESRSGGLSLSLGPIKFGGGRVSSKVWTENEKKRIVNRNYVSNLITDNQTQIQILSDGNPDRIRETKNKIIDFLLKQVATPVSLEFQKVRDNEYNLVQGTIVYANIQGGELETVLRSKPQSEITTESKQSVSNNGGSGSNENNISQKSSDDITWQNKGDGKGWIPSKVDMYILSETDLKSSILIEDVSYVKEGKKTVNADFIYPAVWLSENSKLVNQKGVDRDNPIGSILPFAGNVDKIPAGWRLCNGDTLPIHGNQVIFNVIGYNWGKGKNNDFILPDLRGVFLRGVTFDKPLDVDRIEAKKQSIVGDYQDDMFASHDHTTHGASGVNDNNHIATPTDQGWANADVPTNTTYPTSLKGGKETRPKNVTVNYIIRCN